MYSPREWTKNPEIWEACRGPRSDAIGEKEQGEVEFSRRWRGVKIEVKNEDGEYLLNQ